ncbi:uncharacterized protein LOC136081503 [Hydra vulgaris]|uniref:Uncharacterized protein LOC136081503 n=1 Tax=Hydra vulgaris TaxID=6087 RepID=A0ABM4C050_HYDVU
MENDMNSKKVKELKTIAKEREIKYYYNMRKSDLINALSQISVPAARPVRPVPAPRPVIPVSAPRPVRPVPAPRPVRPVPAPSPVRPVPAPSPVRPVPAPRPVRPVPAPRSVRPVPAPRPVRPVPAPRPVRPVPTPRPVVQGSIFEEPIPPSVSSPVLTPGLFSRFVTAVNDVVVNSYDNTLNWIDPYVPNVLKKKLSDTIDGVKKRIESLKLIVFNKT